MAASQSGPRKGDGARIVGAVDGNGTGQEYVIADITADGAWLSVSAGEAPSLDAWR